MRLRRRRDRREAELSLRPISKAGCRTTDAVDEKPRSAWSWWASRSLLLKISVFVGAAVVFILMWWFLPPLLYAGTSDTSVKAVTDTRTALLAGLLGVGALGTLWINSHNVGLTAEIHAHTVKDATERRVTELSTKAADQLGSDKAPVRLAGLYALERLAQDNPSQRQTIVNVICAYLQMPYAPPGVTPVEPSADAGKSSGDGTAAKDENRATKERERYEKRLQEHEKRAQEQRVRTTALQILLRHISRIGDETIRWKTVIDLSEANLTGARLAGADLTRADLVVADLAQADLVEANLARLADADLTEADLRGADLTLADLGEANLTGADFRQANLTGVHLGGARWTKDTDWPPDLRDTIKTASEDGRHYFRIQDGYRVPPSPTL